MDWRMSVDTAVIAATLGHEGTNIVDCGDIRSFAHFGREKHIAGNVNVGEFDVEAQ